MSLENNELRSFLKKMQTAERKFNSFISDFLLKCAMEALAKTKKRTPVDTGELRRNWDITSVKRGSGGEITVYLYNSKDYASHVEFGHTTRNREGWVEGYYMASISIEEISNKIPKRFESEFIKFMAELGI
jgi:hypothetical protein